MNRSRLLAVWVGLWAVGTGFASAQMQIFLRLDGISGSTTDPNHVGWFDLLSVSGPSVTRSSTVSFDDFCLSKSLDQGSVPLLYQCATGAAIPTGTVDFVLSDYSDTRFFRLNLTNIHVTSISQVAAGDLPYEQVCVSPQSYSWNYTRFRTKNGLPAALISGNWDLALNTGAYRTNSPVFMNTGIRSAGGIILQWDSTAGRDYRIYAVPTLTKPFQLVKQLTAISTGKTNYTFAVSGPTMFYVVEEVLGGY